MPIPIYGQRSGPDETINNVKLDAESRRGHENPDLRAILIASVPDPGHFGVDPDPCP